MRKIALGWELLNFSIAGATILHGPHLQNENGIEKIRKEQKKNYHVAKKSTSTNLSPACSNSFFKPPSDTSLTGIFLYEYLSRR